MRKCYTAILVLMLCVWASAETLTVNGIDYDTERLADNCIIVKFNPQDKPSNINYYKSNLATGMPAFDQLNRQMSVESVGQLFPKSEYSKMPEISGYYSVTFDNQVELANAIEEYQKLSQVEMVEPVPIEPVYYTPNDPLLGSQWGLEKVEAENAWNINQGDADVILAIADSGVDWDHPDLEDDIWVNPNETMDGEDNDNNGFVDDRIGWDWVHGVSGFPGEDNNYPDNDPMDFDGHGTHCSGIAAAVTDNDIGVAGLGFNCKIMCLRIGWRSSNGQAYVRMDFAAQAFYYAADHGATAINCSWGSSYANYFANAVNYAISSDVLVISAAGNDNSSSAPYLGTRNDVIAVAATDQGDYKAGFSNYGSWVDVSAPGVGINSTYFDDNYSTLQGTSMAAPFVVGLAGLIKSAEPSLTWDEIAERILTTADPIDYLNPDYTGQLGSGRINAYAALASHIYPNFSVRTTQITLTDDDGDGILNPGESFELTMAIQNSWADASNVTAIARSNDCFNITDSTAVFGDINNGQVGNNNSDPFGLTACSDITPGTWNVDIDMFAGGIFVQTIELEIDVLLNQAGFPITLGDNIESDPLIFDFDNDGSSEIFDRL